MEQWLPMPVLKTVRRPTGDSAQADFAEMAPNLGTTRTGQWPGGHGRVARATPFQWQRSGGRTPAAAALASNASRCSRQKRDQDSYPDKSFTASATGTNSGA